MDLGNPASAVIPTRDADVYAVLSGTTRGLTGREIARLVRRGSSGGVHNILTRLVNHGLVDAVEAGNAVLYSLNRDHLAADAVIELSDLRGKLVRRLRRTAETWQIPPESMALFGSAARGDGNTSSDLDILLVRPNQVREDDPVWSAQVSDLARLARRWTGNHASILEASANQVDAMVARREPVADSLRTEAIDIAGVHMSELLRKA